MHRFFASTSRLTAIAVAILTLLVASHAAAHVFIEGAGYAGKHKLITFNVPHGCDGADTYRLHVTLPEGAFGSLRTLANATFPKVSIEKDNEGKPTAIIWEKDSVRDSDDQHYQFAFLAKLPEQPFKKLYFPTTQYCESANGQKSSVEWHAVSAGHDHSGGDTHAKPAPSMIVLPAMHQGWNKGEVTEHIHGSEALAEFFGDALIVWAGDKAFSANPETMALIEADKEVEVLKEFHPGTKIQVKY